MTDHAHVDVFVQVNGGPMRLAGHANVPKSDNEGLRQMLGTFFHQLAWSFEESSGGFEGSGDEIAGPQPRRVITPAGDEFFEVAPDEFVVGASWDDAIESYGRHGQSSTFEQVQGAYPRARWEYI